MIKLSFELGRYLTITNLPLTPFFHFNHSACILSVTSLLIFPSICTIDSRYLNLETCGTSLIFSSKRFFLFLVKIAMYCSNSSEKPLISRFISKAQHVHLDPPPIRIFSSSGKPWTYPSNLFKTFLTKVLLILLVVNKH